MTRSVPSLARYREALRLGADLGWVAPEALCPDEDEIYWNQVARIVMPRWSSGRVGQKRRAQQELVGMRATRSRCSPGRACRGGSQALAYSRTCW
ncbi:hypothetical protein OG558_17095 [Kribbella sp. NBC_01510]|uniref:hypothetical protein n=1 Tax=Kribbella sp. NBC_01510 TaxID=2903581 RepID=UPI0038686260